MTTEEPARPAPADLRMPLLGAAAWCGGLVGALPAGVAIALAGIVGAVLLAGRGRWASRTVLTAAMLGIAVAGTALLRADTVGRSPLTHLAADGAVVQTTAVVTSDPVLATGRFSEFVRLRVRVEQVSGRGRTYRAAAPVLVIASPAWAEVRLGSRVRFVGRLAPAEDRRLAGVLTARSGPEVVERPGVLWRGSTAVRTALRESVAHRPADQRSLVPALVVGDDQALPAETEEAFRATGLTHLLAVSGTNLTLVVGFLLVAARWCGVRGRVLWVVGAAGIAGFVVLARTEPSVLRAAAMGAVALVGMGSNGLRRGTRALGGAVVGLLLLDPWLATSVGFALSVLATAGILFLAPVWRDELVRWLPRWCAEAVSVPAAAQLVCTPVVAAVSGQVSLVAVAANLVAAPAIGPATVLGLLGGLLALLADPLGRWFGTPATWCAGWIIAVAERGAALPSAAIGWGTGWLPVIGLTVLCVALALAMPWLLRRPASGLACCLVTAVVVVIQPPTPGWPPRDWILVACDVGQGDGLVLNAGPGAAVVVDAGPDPGPMDRCLDRLEVEAVPLLVLSHFHADHVGGVPGVLAGRRVGEVLVTARAEPAAGVRDVLASVAGRAPVRVPAYAGALTLQVLGPVPGTVLAGADSDDGSAPNNASLVLLAETGGVRVLLTGDAEPPAQAALARAWPGLRADVVKVPHHGSRYQHLDLLLGLGARLAVVSVGEDNEYGHPSPSLLVPMEAAGLTVARTDLDGDVAVLGSDAGLRVATRR